MPVFEAAALFVVALLTSRLAVGSGRPLAVAGLLYAAWRFAAEFGRGDHGGTAGGPFTFPQWISLAVFVAAAGWLPPVGGAIAQEVIDLAAVLNALRAAWPGGELSDY